METASHRTRCGVLVGLAFRIVFFAALTAAALALNVLLADARIVSSAGADSPDDDIIYAVRCLQIADDERTVWAMRQPCRLQNIDLATGRVLLDTPLKNGIATGFQVNARGSHAAFCDQFGHPQILRQGYERSPGLTTPSGKIDLFAVCPRGNGILLSTSVSLELWSLDQTPRLLAMSPLDGSLSALEWSPDGSQILTVQINGDLMLRGGQTLDVVASTSSRTVSGTDVSWSADGRFVLIYGLTGPLTVWDTRADGEIPRHIGDDYRAVAALSPDGRWIVQADFNHGLWLIDVHHPHDRQRFLALATSATAVCFAPDGKHLVVGVLNGDVACWSLADRKLCWQLSGTEI